MTREKIIKALVERKFLKQTIAWVDKQISTITIRFLSRTIKTEKSKILFITFRGEYDCNAKWICEELIQQQLPLQLVWTIRKGTKIGPEYFPQQLQLVRRGSYEFFKEISSAKIIIDNGISTAFLKYKKKKDQILIETWHGSLGIKKFSKTSVNDKDWVKTAIKEGKMTDYCISNSSFEDAVYREDYWKSTPIWKLGHARNDILLSHNIKRQREIKEKIFKQYGISNNTKVCLYAPTFRDDGSLEPYQLDVDALLDALAKRFGGEWVIFIRFHFRMLAQMQKYTMSPLVKDVNRYPDIQELLVCTDVAITDYSSWICDYMLTRRPGFLFATDIKKYEEYERDLFYPLNTMPFPLAENNTQLIENILTFNNDAFILACDAFLQEKGCIDDGHAAKRIVKKIKRLLEIEGAEK